MKKKPSISPERPDLFAALFDHAKVNCVILMDEHGIILQVNEAFKNAFGYTESNIIGQHSRVLFTPEDRKMLRPEMELSLVKKQGFSTDHNYTLHANGEPIWVSGESVWAESREYGNCVVKVIQNIHAQKVQEKFLTEANELTQTVFESIDIGLLVLDADMRILKANQAFFRLFDLKPLSLEGTYLQELDYALHNNPKMQESLARAGREAHFEEEMEWNVPGGNKRMLRLTSKFMDQAAEQKRRILLLFNDITEEKQASQQREDLINFVSHELRNPMANLALVIELVPDAVKNNHTEEVNEYLGKAKVNLRRLKQVIAELHDATRAGTGHLTIKKASFDVDEMIREAIDSVKMLYPSHQVLYKAGVTRNVIADRFRLIQVLTNYLTNAIKYSPGSNKVELNVAQENGRLVVSVTDQGPGIPPDQLPYVFNKYYRGKSTVKIDGLGLGLYVCKEIISAHDGQVWAHSDEGRGSTFYFSLPL